MPYNLEGFYRDPRYKRIGGRLASKAKKAAEKELKNYPNGAIIQLRINGDEVWVCDGVVFKYIGVPSGYVVDPANNRWTRR